VAKDWKSKERLTSQFLLEFFHLFIRSDFSTAPDVTDPEVVQFGCFCPVPRLTSAIPWSGGPRHIQFVFKLIC